MRVDLYRAVLVAAFLFLAGCTGRLGLPDPVSAQDRIVREAIHAQKMADAADLTVIDLLERRAISSKTAQEVGEASDAVRSAARSARTVLAQDWNNTSGAMAYLQAADVSLRLLDGFLRRNK